MKKFLYPLAIVAILAACVFSWQAKQKFTEQIAAYDALVDKNNVQSGAIAKKQDEKEEATAKEATAQKEKSKSNSDLESAKANATELATALDSIAADLAVASAEKKKIDDSIEALSGKFPGIELEEVPRVVKDLEANQKKLVGEEQDASLVKKRLEEEIAKNLAESSRIADKINQSIARIEGNTFQATIVAVDNDWNFVVIGAGEKSGLTGDSKLLIQRDGRLLGRLFISKLEPNTAVADVEPGSLKNGVALQPGDQVILESVSSN